MASRSVIITGAASGVGAACARRFAAAGDKLVLADKKEDAGKAFTKELVADGATATFVHADVANRLHVHNIIAEALDAYGRIDVLAHTVMEQFSAPFFETSEEDFDRIVAANIRGAFLINQAAAKQFVKQSKPEGATDTPGAIVNIGSVEAVTAAADHVAFAASQGGLHQLTKAIAMALSPHAIRVNAVGVGSIKGELDKDVAQKQLREATPLKRIGDPEEVAEVVFFLASEAASYVTGQCLYVDGGRLAQTDSMKEKPKDD
ncbi:MAG: dehydrogenase [Hyphococcus sp.]|nr:MAG: dehydrogenase [Marinicaulis sp.]